MNALTAWLTQWGTLITALILLAVLLMLALTVLALYLLKHLKLSTAPRLVLDAAVVPQTTTSALLVGTLTNHGAQPATHVALESDHPQGVLPLGEFLFLDTSHHWTLNDQVTLAPGASLTLTLGEIKLISELSPSLAATVVPGENPRGTITYTLKHGKVVFDQDPHDTKEVPKKKSRKQKKAETQAPVLLTPPPERRAELVVPLQREENAPRPVVRGKDSRNKVAVQQTICLQPVLLAQADAAMLSVAQREQHFERAVRQDRVFENGLRFGVHEPTRHLYRKRRSEERVSPVGAVSNTATRKAPPPTSSRSQGAPAEQKRTTRTSVGRGERR